jgi:hypothetical protein
MFLGLRFFLFYFVCLVAYTVFLAKKHLSNYTWGENSWALPRCYKFKPLDYACHSGKTIHDAPTLKGRPPFAFVRAQLTQRHLDSTSLAR